MKHKWLAFLTIGFLAAIVLLFFVISLRPVRMPSPMSGTSGSERIEEPTVTFVNPSRGPSDAQVTIVEFADFQCPYCADLAASLEQVRSEFPDEVRVVWKNLPNDSAHPQATNAAVAAHCAARQGKFPGKFWEYHDLLFARMNFLSDEQYAQIALELGLDAQAFESCYVSRDTEPIVERDVEEAFALGITATPTIFVNGEPYVGAISATDLFLYVQQALE